MAVNISRMLNKNITKYYYKNDNGLIWQYILINIKLQIYVCVMYHKLNRLAGNASGVGGSEESGEREGDGQKERGCGGPR